MIEHIQFSCLQYRSAFNILVWFPVNCQHAPQICRSIYLFQSSTVHHHIAGLLWSDSSRTPSHDFILLISSPFLVLSSTTILTRSCSFCSPSANSGIISSASSSDRVDSRGPLRQPRVATTTSLGPFGTNVEGCTIADLLDPWMPQASWPSPLTRTKTGASSCCCNLS